MIKIWRPAPYNYLRHADNRKYISGLSDVKSMGSIHVLQAREVEKIWRCSCREKGNFIVINEFNMVKPEKFDHLYLVFHFTVPLTYVLGNYYDLYKYH